MDKPDTAVILVGHGGVPRDYPRPLLAELKALESQRRSRGEAVSPREQELEDHIRTWPRNEKNDPYRAGVEKLAIELRRAMSATPVEVAYNEFCAPTIAEAACALARRGIRRIVVIPSMLTPGGVHSEQDIPEALEELRAELPDVEVRYAWPVDLGEVARLMAGEIRRFA